VAGLLLLVIQQKQHQHGKGGNHKRQNNSTDHNQRAAGALPPLFILDRKDSYSQSPEQRGCAQKDSANDMAFPLGIQHVVQGKYKGVQKVH
jgi:hypothetical protein